MAWKVHPIAGPSGKAFLYQAHLTNELGHAIKHENFRTREECEKFIASTTGVQNKQSAFNKPLAAIIGGLFAICVLGNGIGKVTTAAAPVATTVAPETECKSDWTKCADNSEMANNYNGWRHAKSQCKAAAANLAKYGTPEFPWPTYFSTFLKGSDYASKGVAVLYEDDAKFQNGFGAMAHVEVRCEYDLRAKKVVDINLS